MQQFTLHRNIQRRLFVTGTDTGVGKSEVSTALLAAWRRAGRTVAALKPVETGCLFEDGRLRGADAERLAAATGLDDRIVGPLRFRMAASPAAASVQAGGPSGDELLAAIDRALLALPAAELLLIEGAGGLLAPLDRTRTMADLARAFDAPLLVVARSSLGTVSHTLLTVEAAERRGLRVVGVVLSRSRPDAGEDEPGNAAAIAERIAPPVLGTLPYLGPSPTVDALAEAAVRHLDLDRLGRDLAPPF